ncbi:MAG TPA: endolytic transglycosylase MltG [Hydrogenothermaceae bacterium]|nr:endolytic transglycosylase MltG [Hydrogenothermaceae bacterium]
MINILSKKYKRFIFYLEIILILFLLSLAYHFMPMNNGKKVFYIPSSDIRDIVHTLKNNGYEVTWIDQKMLTLKKIPEEGWYSVTPSKQGRFSFFLHLHTQKTNALMDIIVYAGETKEEITQRLAKDMNLEQKSLMQYYQTLAQFEEGDILAQRYTLARNADENTTIHYLFLASNRTLREFQKAYLTTPIDKDSLKRLLSIASIIQKESNSIQEMPLIASVIYNRLEKNMRLQIDGTLNYGKYAHTIITPERIKNDMSLYNTYKYKGLPPHPLSSVSIDTLKASVNPQESKYLFFMLTPQGTHGFSESYKEHLEKITVFRKYQEEKEKKKKAENNQTKSFGIGFKAFEKFRL